MKTNHFLEYTTEYISGVMSLRTPQKDSLAILDDIMTNLNIRKDMNLKAALGSIHSLYPICSDFEREFLSITFALATGVGKTRLMGAFIAYLYTNHNIKNFFVVAPNTTIYDKLKRDLSDTSSAKYVFKGLGCFQNPPHIITDDDYKSRQLSLFESDVRIFVYNIDKFNKDESNMKKLNEMIGDSFYDYLSSLEDLVVIMDESHHYRAKKGMQAINDLKPMLGLELTATPIVTSGTKQVPFKNVVYEYPLSKAIADGYTRTPFASTRTDIKFYEFGQEDLDRVMILDGLKIHEDIKKRLKQYALTHSTEKNSIPIVKPFMMVVCKDIEHATFVENFIKSDDCMNGSYRNKTIVVHSKQKGSESEANTKLLLEVERADNPVEVVIHVDKLKEGWDVNNLYTIVPLRTASSKVLREQMVGRGLRLPFGKRTGDSRIDGVYLTAHDKFQDILEEAQKGDSIFKAGNIIKIEEIEEEKTTISQLAINFEEMDTINLLEKMNVPQNDKTVRLVKNIDYTVQKIVDQLVLEKRSVYTVESHKTKIIENVVNTIKADKDLGDVYTEFQGPLFEYLTKKTKETARISKEKFIPIPQIKITDEGIVEYGFVDFDLELTLFNQQPITNELLIQNLQDARDVEKISADPLYFQTVNPQKVLLALLREKPEIDYEKCSQLLQKLITQVCTHFEDKFGYDYMRNIIMMYKKTIANTIYQQMMLDTHFYREQGFLQESVIGTREYNLPSHYSYKEKQDLFDVFKEGNIKSILFTGIKKGVFSEVKFDSKPELIFARVLEKDLAVINWLRPSPSEFNITYNNGKKYEPDFVVEMQDYNYIVEVKGEDKLENADVIAKRNRTIKYCEIASNWAKANGYKEWRYVFIPSLQIMENSTTKGLFERFIVNE